MTTQELPKAKPLNMGGVVAAIPQRRLSQETCSRFGVTVEYSSTGEIQKHFYPYYDLESGEVCAAKVREVKTKGFYATGDMSGAGFFGQQQCKSNKYITITEGELDALSTHLVCTRCLTNSTTWFPYGQALVMLLRKSRNN
jgi:twinkle protein